MCGVPLTALPFATLMSAKTGKPMLMRRKEVKAYGTKKAIEGVYTAGQTCLIVEDLVTSGLSVFETVAPLETEVELPYQSACYPFPSLRRGVPQQGLTVNDVVVLLDRGQGGRTNVETRGKALYSVTTLPEVLQILHTAGKVDDATRERVLQFIEANQVAQMKEGLAPTCPHAPDLHRLLSSKTTVVCTLRPNPTPRRHQPSTRLPNAPRCR